MSEQNVLESAINTEDNEELGSSVITTDDVTNPAKKENIIKTLPGEESPLIFKIVPQKRNGKMVGYWPVYSHTHLVGDCDPNNRKNYRSHLCQKMFSKDCPECNKYYANLDRMKEFEKTGKKGTPEYNKLEIQNKFLKPAFKAWVYVVTPDSPEVRAIKLPRDIVNKLWGKGQTKFRPAVPSLITQMSANGHDIYNLRSNTGWVKAWKTGEGMATAYSVEAATVVVTATLPNGQNTQARVAMDQPIHENILKTKRSDLPDLEKFEERNIWKPEDSLYFSVNLRAPDYILESSRGVPEDDDDPLSANSSPDVGIAGGPPDTSATDSVLMGFPETTSAEAAIPFAPPAPQAPAPQVAPPVSHAEIILDVDDIDGML